MEYFFQSYQYTIQFFSALGTCGAVIISLWILLKRYKKFKVTNLMLWTMFNAKNDGISRELSFDIKNVTEYEMLLYGAVLYVYNDSSCGEGAPIDLRGNKIAPFSLYHVHARIENYSNQQYIDSLSKITLELDTGFGKRVVELSKKEFKQFKSGLQKKGIKYGKRN